jgi:flagellar basal body rod protein FlgG
MLRGLYAAATALDAAQQAHEVTAANLAHASVSGYRQRGVRFETFDRVLNRASPPTGDIVGTRFVTTYIDFQPGALQQTSNPFDLALSEPHQFFTVQGPNGPLYTRNGNFRLNAQGQVVTQSGYPLLADSGEVVVPPNTVRISIASDGSISADGTPAGRVRLVRFADPNRLTPAGPTHFTALPDMPPQEVAGRVLQGYREASNGNAAEGMVSMITATRYYEAAQRVLRAISESVQLNTRPQG